MADIEKIQPMGDSTQYTLRARTDSKGNVITDYYLPLKTAGGLKENSGGGSSTYFKLATLVITGGYVNRPIVFELSRRGYGFQKLEIMFASNSTNDPNLNYIRTDGEDLGFWINKTATSTWEVYGRYSESHGSCTVHRITGSATDNGVTVTLNLENIGTTQPEGTQARRGYSARYADIAVTLNSNAGSSTVPIYFSGGKPVQCSTTLGVSITGNAATATALTTSAGSSSVPIYFSGGKPVQCSTKLGVSITGSAGSVAWGNVTGKPGSFTPASHTHNWLELAPGDKASSTGAAQSDDTGPFNVRWYATSNRIAQQPTQYGFLITCATGKGSAEMHQLWLEQSNGHIYHRGTNSNSNSSPPAFKMLWQRGDSVTGAVWNDYAEYREAETIEPGYILCEKGDGSLYKSIKRCQEFAGVSSDTWGFAQGETEKAKTPIAVSGRVLVYVKDKVKVNDYICSGPDGIGLKMHWWEKILYPHRVVGIVSEIPTYEKWGGGENADRDQVDVNGRIWIKCCN